MVEEEARIHEVIRMADMELNAGQFTDVEAFEEAIRLGVVERSYIGVHTIFAMLGLPKVVVTDKAHDWMEERGLDL